MTTRHTFFGHPWGLATLSATELWERFSFYGMRALLVLYLVAALETSDASQSGLGFDAGDAAAVYGSYNALVYLTPLAGGWIADRLIGARRSVLVGGIIIALGHYSMAAPWEGMFWAGLLLIAAGTGLLKPNVSQMVGDLYVGQPESRKDAAFSIFYMGINMGGFLAPLVTGWLALSYGWEWGFLAAGIGMTIAIVIYVVGWPSLGSAGSVTPNPATRAVLRRVLVRTGAGLGLFALAVLGYGLWAGFSVEGVTVVLTWAIIAIAVVYFVVLFRSPLVTSADRPKLKAFMALFIGAALFWMLFDQAGSTLTILASDWTDRSIGSWVVPAPWLLSVNPVLIIIFAPVFAWLWTKLANRAPSTPMKFAIAIIGVGLSFWLLIIPGMAADRGESSMIWWLLGAYLLQTWSELLLSPTGLAASTTLAPVGLGSQMLGLWFLAASVGDAVGGQVVRLFSGYGFGPFFGVLGSIAVLVGIGYVFLARRVSHLMR
ncbi:MAG TPA: MFS transporter [Actinobacteria bacterium]|nr:MFS transporter [Actinomycetota bacterium]